VANTPAGPAEPAGPGIAVQVSAFRVRQEADALANRLVGKGYSAYVVPPAPGAPALFRVRVGKFKESGEANKVAAKLKKEEQFDPWIVR
jgi:cell division septation protein DedD